MTRRNISNEATVRELIGLSPRSMHATVLACMPSASATADCVKPSDSRRARKSAGRIGRHGASVDGRRQMGAQRVVRQQRQTQRVVGVVLQLGQREASFVVAAVPHVFKTAAKRHGVAGVAGAELLNGDLHVLRSKNVGDTKRGHQLRELRVRSRVVAVTGQHTGNDARRSFPCGRPSGGSFVSGYGAAVERDNHVRDSVLRCDSKVLSRLDSVKGQFMGGNELASLGVAATAQGDA